MSDETKGWSKTKHGGWEKVVGGQCYDVYICRKGWAISVGNVLIATRRTLAECQHLAHATARLWAGDTT